MKKIFIACFCAFLGACTCICPSQPVRVISNEKHTDIYYNNELLGSDSTYAILQNKGVEKATLSGEKRGCETTKLPVQHNFDYGVLNIFDVRNIVRLISWDVYEVDTSKDLYNVTPKCR